MPDDLAAPDRLPPDFFNTTSPRGAVFAKGRGVQVSADAANPTAAPVEFGHLDPENEARFRTFSAQRLFAPLGSNVMEVRFVVPGEETPAAVSGFGAVFTDVDRARSTQLEFLDRLPHVRREREGAGGGRVLRGPLLRHPGLLAAPHQGPGQGAVPKGPGRRRQVVARAAGPARRGAAERRGRRAPTEASDTPVCETSQRRRNPLSSEPSDG